MRERTGGTDTMGTAEQSVPRRAGTKGARTTEELKEAARRVFARVGYLNATVPDIAKEAGKSPAAFYKYFESKRGLLEVLLGDFLDDFGERTKMVGRLDLSRYEDVYTAVEAFWRAYTEYRAEWLGLMHASAVDAEFLGTWMRIRDLGVRRIVEAVRQAQSAGRLPDDLDAAVVASNLSAMMEHSCYLWIGLDVTALGRPQTASEAIASVATLWHRALWSSGT